MEIIDVKLNFARNPKPMVVDAAATKSMKIIICSADQDYIDVGQLHNVYKDNGYSGFIYHYVIKSGSKNSDYDGNILYCRPVIYQNDITSKGNNTVNNSISICMGGSVGVEYSDNQRESLVKLTTYLSEVYCMPMESVVFLSDLTGDKPEVPNKSEILEQIKNKISNTNTFKAISQISTQKGIPIPDICDNLITLTDSKTLLDIAEITKVPIGTLADFNPHVKYSYEFQVWTFTPIKPNTPIFFPKSHFSMALQAMQQSHIGDVTVEKIKETVTIKLNEKSDYLANKNKIDIYDPTTLTTMWGGKKKPSWSYDLPGYHNALLKIIDKRTNKAEHYQFMISPSSFNDIRNNTQQINKTNGGWFIIRTGRGLSSVNLNGYMLDVRDNMERHDFLERYKTFIEDQKNEQFEYINYYSAAIVIEGREYHGYIQNISLSKSGTQMFLYQYSISFIIVNEMKIYNPAYALKNVKEFIDSDLKNAQISTLATPSRTTEMYLTNGMMEIFRNFGLPLIPNILL